MANEGFMGKHKLGGERVFTSDHQVVTMYLPLSENAKKAPIEQGMVMKRVDDALWEPMLAADETPGAVVDMPCDPTGDSAETSALCVVHGGVKMRMLKTGDGKELTDVQIALLMERGIYAI